MTKKPPLTLSADPVYVVCQVHGPSETIYEGTEREFTDREEALRYMMQAFKNMYGTIAQDDYVFWDPINQDNSTELYSIELFGPDEEDGWFLYRKWETAH